jgi:hypothetical protein
VSTENSKAAVIKAAVIKAAVILARCAILKPATALFRFNQKRAVKVGQNGAAG